MRIEERLDNYRFGKEMLNLIVGGLAGVMGIAGGVHIVHNKKN